MTGNTLSEIELLKASLQGQTQAFEVIVKEYQSLICAITYSATGSVERSEELAQQAFVKCWKNLGQLKDLTKFRAWLCRIARHVVNDSYRRQNNDVTSGAISVDSIQNQPSEERGPVEAAISREREAIVNEALSKIPDTFREPLVLYYREGRSYREVGNQLGFSEHTARERVSRAQSLLREKVACLVEETIEKTKPGKAFSAVVIASIAGVTIKGSGAGAAVSTVTSAGGAAGGVVPVMSGAAGKMIAAAAVVAIGIGAVVTYRQITKTGSGPEFSQTETITREKEEEGISEEAQRSQGEKSFADAAADTGANEHHEILPGGDIGSESAEPITDENTNKQSSKPEKPKTGVSGIVVSKSDSKPIRRAEVFYGQRNNPEVSSFTDVNGRFEFPDMEAHERQFLYIIAKGFTSRRITLDIVKDKVYENFKIELTPGSKVAGVVYDQNDKPVKGATVGTFQFTNHPAVTDANGFFEIDGLDPAWGQYSLHVTHPNYPALSADFSPANAGEAVWKDVILRARVTVYGQVSDTRGNPVANVEVGNTASRAMWNRIETKTNHEGKYELKNVEVGELVLWAISNKYAPYVERFDLDSSQAKRLINIRLSDSVPLHGKVVDKEGNPVAGVSVCVSEYKGVRRITNWQDRVSSDTEGRFVIPNGPSEGTVILAVFADSVPNAYPELEAGGQEESVIEVDRAGRVYGKVVDDKTGEPVKRFNVKLTLSKSARKPRWGFSATWNRAGHNFDSAEGFFDTGRENIPIGAEYSMTVYADGFDRLTIDPVIVHPVSNEPNRTEFRLKAATAIAGRVVDSNNVPIAGARVRVLSDNTDFEHWDDRDTAVTDSKGEFLLSGAGSEERGIYVTAERFAPYLDSSLDLPKNAGGMVEITLESGLEVFGRVVDANGRGIADARVSAHIFSANQLGKLLRPPWPNLTTSTRTDMEGYYELFDLPAGDISVHVSFSTQEGNETAGHKRIKLEHGRPVELNFADAVGFRVTGTVRMGQTLLEEAHVEIHLPDNSVKRGRTDSEGRFEISGIPEGTHTISTSYRSGSNRKTSQRERGLRVSDTRRVAVEGNTELEIKLGDSSVGGEIPVQFVQSGNMQVVRARRWAPKEPQDGIFLQRWEHAASAEVDSDGKFRCTNLWAGRYYLLLSSSDGDTLGITDAFDLDESEQMDNVTFNTGNGTLRISVIDADTSQGIPNAVFCIRNDLEAVFYSNQLAPEGSRYGMTTDGNGWTEYGALPDGNYVVWAEARGFLPGESEWVKIHDGAIRSVTVSLEPAAVVRFELDSVVKERITGEYVYLRCRVTDAETQELVPMFTFYGEYAEHMVWLDPEKISIRRQPDLKLHGGTYKIEYRLYQDSKGSLSYKVSPALLEGTVIVELNKGEIRLITISPGV